MVDEERNIFSVKDGGEELGGELIEASSWWDKAAGKEAKEEEDWTEENRAREIGLLEDGMAAGVARWMDEDEEAQLAGEEASASENIVDRTAFAKFNGQQKSTSQL